MFTDQMKFMSSKWLIFFMHLGQLSIFCFCI